MAGQVLEETDVGFAPGSEVEVRQDGEASWITLRPLTYHGREETFEVPAGQPTDFASVPRPFVWFLPRYGRYTKAAILHDHLCREQVPAGELSRADADGIFRQAMRTLDVPFLRRWIMWAAVRIGALTSVNGWWRWLRDSWRVVPIAMLALPVLLPAAAVIVVTIPTFYVIELVVWLVLLAARRARGAAGPHVKRLNRPRLRLTL